MTIKKPLLILLLLVTHVAGRGQSMEQEANLKAAFVYNFTKYIDWGRYDDNYVFIIGVIGDEAPIIEPLKEIARTRTVDNKRIEIRVIDDLSELKNCDILFISDRCQYPLSTVLDRVGKGVLTVGESKGYAALGTDFNFIVVDQRLKFEVNLSALALSGLKVGSQLLKLAVIVRQ